METLFQKIQRLVDNDCYVVGLHAAERLEERGMLEWQVVAGLKNGSLVRERLKAKPNPVVEIRETLPDGADVTAIWAFLSRSGVAKLVTVHFIGEK